jgi:membrane-bound lytic murein transglycosylase D
MKILAALLFVAVVVPAAAQTPEVPHKMEFAGITLIIRDDARREIQKDVDALTLSPKHYNIKVERARTYFPIIEKVFAEEQVPDDFKYLSLQESALIADAVSVSNAVGFWQFKDFTALEMGLRVDKDIDERMNIVSSTRAAARYIKKNNLFFDNWIYALQAYQSGAGGVMKSVKDTQNGAKHMEITSQTYWYVKKYLAHKIAYEPSVKGSGAIDVITFNNSNGRSLADLAKEVSVGEEELRNYNKWTKTGVVPTDRTYAVIIPVAGKNTANLLLANNPGDRTVNSATARSANATAVKKRVNGVPTIQAVAGENSVSLAARAGVEASKFLQWNDLKQGEALIAGNFYFLGKKRGRATENFHKVQPGENLWSVSQQYGVQLRKLKKFNRLSTYENVPVGTMLWLASTRPKSDPVQKQVETTIVVNNEETFNWEAAHQKGATVQDSVVLPAESVGPVASSQSSIQTIESDSARFELEVETVPQASDSIQSGVVTEIVRKTHHTVQVKETLYGIAKIYNVGVMDLVRWNNLDLQQGIKPGQILRVSEEQPVMEAQANKQEPVPSVNLTEILHEVKSSDTLYSIARQYGVTIKQIMDWNEKKDFSLAVGEKLKIQQR